MRFSIITVCRNASEAIAETLESALSQIGTTSELIVIDGASTDGTIEIVERYRDRLGAFVSEPDSSIYEAMNKGIERAGGEYLYFLNAGDILAESDVLARIDRGLQGNPELLIGDVWLEDPDGFNGVLKRHTELDKPHFYRGSVTQQAIFYRRDVFERCGRFDETLKIVGDHDWLIRGLFLKRLKVRYWPHVICKFRRGGVSTSTDQAVKVRHQEERIHADEAVFSAWEKRLLESRKFQWLLKYSCGRGLAGMLLGWRAKRG